MKSTFLSAVLAASAVAVLPLTSAAQIIGPLNPTAPIVNETTELTSYAGPDVLEFAKFDGSLGTLFSVFITGTGSINSSVTVTNLAATPSSGSVNAASQFTFEAPDATSLVVFTAFTNSQTYSLGPGQSTTFNGMTGSSGGSATITDPNILAFFTGSAGQTINVGVKTFTQTFLANTGGNTAASQVTVANANGTITYNYQPAGDVPEPGTWAMLVGAGTVGARLFLRRRRK
jgi:hypothetical protein